MTVGAFVVVVTLLGSLWFIKVSCMLDKAEEADKAETNKHKVER